MRIARILQSSLRSGKPLNGFKSKSDGFKPRSNGYNSRNEDFKPRNNNFRRDNNNYYNKSNNFRGRNDFKSKRFNDRNEGFDDQSGILDRTRARKVSDDGFMGQKPYEIDTAAIANLKWNDLISENAESVPQGVSPVKTQMLADKKILSLPLVNSLIHNRKYEYLTPVQAETILPILRNESVVVRAKTGTGKTGAFAIPIIQKVLEAKSDPEHAGKVSALIVSPTRELAQQIADEIFKITQFGGLNHVKVQCFVGGLSKERQIHLGGLGPNYKPNRVCDIVVATPGRLVDILGDEGVRERFSDLKFRVFDEADRILDIGFEREMEMARDMINEVSGDKEIPLLLFSATADKTMRQFARRQFGDRVKVIDTVPENEPAPSELVEQHSVRSENWADLYENASKVIYEEYERAKEDGTNFKAVVFLPTTAMVDHYRDVLKLLFGRNDPITNSIYAVHGQVKQSSRQMRADNFRKATNAILLTTDVVARGMDFPNVSHVFQLGPPADVASYVHRIGRTARIGNSGKSFMFFTKHSQGYIAALEADKIKTKVSVYNSHPEFKEKMEDVFARAANKEEEAEDVISSLLAYSALFKKRYNMRGHEFVRDLQPFVDIMGLEDYDMGQSQRKAWLGGQNKAKSRKGYGSSRKTRMRW